MSQNDITLLTADLMSLTGMGLFAIALIADRLLRWLRRGDGMSETAATAVLVAGSALILMGFLTWTKWSPA